MSGLSVLAVDDEEPALDELRYLLRSSPHVSGLSLAQSATEALMRLQEGGIDVVLKMRRALEDARFLAELFDLLEVRFQRGQAGVLHPIRRFAEDEAQEPGILHIIVL